MKSASAAMYKGNLRPSGYTSWKTCWAELRYARKAPAIIPAAMVYPNAVRLVQISSQKPTRYILIL